VHQGDQYILTMFDEAVGPREALVAVLAVNEGRLTPECSRRAV